VVVRVVILRGAGLLAIGAPLAWWLIICGMLAWRRVSSQYAFTVAVSPDGVRIRRGLLGTVAGASAPASPNFVCLIVQK